MDLLCAQVVFHRLLRLRDAPRHLGFTPGAALPQHLAHLFQHGTRAERCCRPRVEALEFRQGCAAGLDLRLHLLQPFLSPRLMRTPLLLRVCPHRLCLPLRLLRITARHERLLRPRTLDRGEARQ